MTKVTLSMFGQYHEQATVYFDTREEAAAVDWDNTTDVWEAGDVDYYPYGFVPDFIYVDETEYELKQADFSQSGEPENIEISGLAVTEYQYTQAITDDFEIDIDGEFDIRKLKLVWENGVCTEIEYDDKLVTDDLQVEVDGMTKSDGLEYRGFTPEEFDEESDSYVVDLDDYLMTPEEEAELEKALLETLE